MRYRTLGSTGLMVSEIGFGGEWMDRSPEETLAVVRAAEEAGINILDCWMNDATRRSNLGDALRELDSRERWVIQGHLGSVTVDGQYTRTRDLDLVRPAFEDLLERFHTDYVDLGMIHYVDKVEEYERIVLGDSPFMRYVRELRAAGTIRHIGLSTHNTEVARRVAENPEIEMMLFSVNPAFDMMPATENLDDLFGDYTGVGEGGINADRAELYARAEETGTGITVMKGYAGGRLLDAATSPFGVALTPVQCIHYALTRPAVASIMVGFSTPAHVVEAVAYETASVEERDYASVLAGAPRPKGIDIPTVNKFYDLAALHNEVPDSVRDHYRALDAHAGDCIACHACEGRCPFGVKVADKMAAAAGLFGL